VTDRALVTGACGSVGSHLIEHLVERGWEVVATDLAETRRDAYYADAPDGDGVERPDHGYHDGVVDGTGVEFVPADLTERATLEPLFDRPYDVLFHTASLFDYFAEPETLHAVNVEGGRNVGELAADHDVGHLVHWSTLDVCGGTEVGREEPASEDAPYDPRNAYGRSKVEQERALLDVHDRTDLPVTVLRPAPVYGPRHRYGVYHLLYLLRTIGVAPVVSIYPRDRQLRFPSVHVEDLARAALFVFRHRRRTAGEIYHVTSDPIPQDDLMAFLATVLDLPRPRIPLPWRLYRAIAGRIPPVAALLERRARRRGVAPRFPASMARFLTRDFWFTAEKLEREEFEFVYEDPRRGLREYVTWCRERGLI